MIFENNENDKSLLEKAKINANWVGEAVQEGAKTLKEKAGEMMGEATRPKPSAANCVGGENLPKRMKIAEVQSHQSNPSRGEPCVLKEVDVPVPDKREVLVKIRASGCCFSDIHAIIGDWNPWIKAKMPLVTGHEGIGIVVQKGPDVSEVEIGDRVGVQFLRKACGMCENCVGGWETLCPKVEAAGYAKDGCMGEYVLGVGAYVTKIPDELSDEQAAPLMCAGVTVYKGIKETEARPGQFITIVGAAGGLGHLAIQYAKAMGLRVIAVDRGAKKKEFCEKLGAELALDVESLGGHKEMQAAVLAHTGGMGSHAILLTATTPEVFSEVMPMCRRMGVIVLLGVMGDDMKLPIPDMVLRRITIRGSNLGNRQDTREALDFAVRGLVKVQVVTRPFDQINDVYQKLNDGQIEGRVVLMMDPSKAGAEEGHIMEGDTKREKDKEEGQGEEHEEEVDVNDQSDHEVQDEQDDEDEQEGQEDHDDHEKQEEQDNDAHELRSGSRGKNKGPGKGKGGKKGRK